MPSLSGVIKQASRGADLYFVFRFLRLLTMDWKKTDAYKYKIIDAKGKALKRSSELESVNEKAAYTMLHRMVFKIRRLIEKIPLIGKSILMNYAAALFLLKEQNDKRVWTDENYMERKLLEFLESDWEEEADQLKEVFRGQYGLTQANEFLTERTMTDGEKEKREEIVLSMKKKSSELKAKYGDDWENIMYATATKQAMGEEITADKGRSMKSFTEFQLDEIAFEVGKVYHQDTNDGPLYFKAVEQQKNKRWKGLVLDIGKKKPKSGSADEKLRFWKATPDSDIPPALKEAVEIDEDAKMGKQTDDNLRKLYKTASEKDQSSPANKSFTKRVEKEMKKRGIKEEVEIEESSMLQAKMALSDAGLKHKEHNGKLIVNKKDKKKVQDALNKSFAKKGTPPKLTIASGSFQEEVEIDEEPANVTGANVAGTGDDPVHWQKKKKKKPAWEDSRVLMNKFAGKDVFIVDSDMFHTCRMGKKKYHRYEKYVGIKRVGNAIREYGLKFPKRPIILQNGEDGPMLFLRYGRS